MPTDASVAPNGQLGKLLDHLEWADRRVLDSLRAMVHPDPRALELYAHVLGAEHNWLVRMLQQPARQPIWPDISLDEAAVLAAENAKGLRELLGSNSSDQLQRKASYTNSAGLAFESTLEDMLLQVFLHGSYHRGQVALIVRGAGGEPAPSDYMQFVRGVPAAVTARPRR